MRSTLFTLPLLGLPVPAFGVMMMLGVVLGMWWASKRAEKVHCDGEFIMNLGLMILLSSIAGARLFYVIHYLDRFTPAFEDSFIKGVFGMINVRQGGLEFYGGFLAAVAAVVVYLRYRQVSLRLCLDILVPSVALGLAFGRIG